MNRSPRSRKAERKHQRRAGGLRLVRKWATCREERWSGDKEERESEGCQMKDVP